MYNKQGSEMKSKILGLVAMGLPAGPLAAHATLVSWQFGGTLNTVSGTASEISGVAAGDAFSVILTFDTAAPVTNPVGCGIPANPGGLGTTCRHNGPNAQLAFTSLQLGSKFFPEFTIDPNRNVIIVRNNVDIGTIAVPNIVDGYSFGSSEYDGTERAGLNLILRGPEDLSVVTDGRFLPAVLLPGMLSLGHADLRDLRRRLDRRRCHRIGLRHCLRQWHDRPHLGCAGAGLFWRCSASASRVWA